MHVLLVDLDLRRPTLDKFFDLRGLPGVVDVLDGDVSLDEVLVAGNRAEDRPDVRGFAHAPGRPHLEQASCCSRVRAEQPARQAREDEADIVLIDSPPMLNVGDALGLSARVTRCSSSSG